MTRSGSAWTRSAIASCSSICGRAAPRRGKAGRPKLSFRESINEFQEARVKVLLTVHHGYIRTLLGPMLHKAGHEVVGLDTNLFAGGNFGEPPQLFPTLHFDVRDVPVEALRGFDAVIHLAGISNDPL